MQLWVCAELQSGLDLQANMNKQKVPTKHQEGRRHSGKRLGLLFLPVKLPEEFECPRADLLRVGGVLPCREG